MYLSRQQLTGIGVTLLALLLSSSCFAQVETSLDGTVWYGADGTTMRIEQTGEADRFLPANFHLTPGDGSRTSTRKGRLGKKHTVMLYYDAQGKAYSLARYGDRIMVSEGRDQGLVFTKRGSDAPFQIPDPKKAKVSHWTADKALNPRVAYDDHFLSFFSRNPAEKPTGKPCRTWVGRWIDKKSGTFELKPSYILYRDWKDAQSNTGVLQEDKLTLLAQGVVLRFRPLEVASPPAKPSSTPSPKTAKAPTTVISDTPYKAPAPVAAPSRIFGE